MNGPQEITARRTKMIEHLEAALALADKTVIERALDQ